MIIASIILKTTVSINFCQTKVTAEERNGKEGTKNLTMRKRESHEELGSDVGKRLLQDRASILK